MRFNRQVLLAAGLIFVQLCASISVPSVSFAQSATAPTTVAATTTQPHTTTGYPSWRQFPMELNSDGRVITAQGSRYIWFSGFSGVVKYDTSTNQIVNIFSGQDLGLFGGNITAIAVDNSGNIWVGSIYSSGGGASVYNGTSWQTFSTANSGLPSNQVSAITVDTVGNVWFSTDNGIAKYNGSGWQTFTTTNSGLKYNAIGNLAADKKGNVWATAAGSSKITDCSNPTPSGVLSKFDGNTWTNFFPPNQNNVPQNPGIGLAIDTNGNVWLDLFDNCGGTPKFNGITKFNGSTWQIYSPSEVSGSQQVFGYKIATDSLGNVWVPSQYSLNEFNGSTWQSFQNPDIDPPYSFIGYGNITIDANNNTWIVAQNYLIKFNLTNAMLLPEKRTITLNATPNSVSPTDTLTVYGYNVPITYSASITYSSDTANWLSVTLANGIINTNSSQDLAISVNTGSLTTGVYKAFLTITDQNDSTDTFTVPIVLQVGYVYYLPNLEDDNVDQYGPNSSDIVIQNTSHNTTATIVFDNEEDFLGGLGSSCKTLAPSAQCIVNDFPFYAEAIAKKPHEVAISMQTAVISDQKLNIIATNSGYPYVSKTAEASTQVGSQLVTPIMLNNAFGGYNTGLNIANFSPIAVTVTLQFYNQNGHAVQTSSSNLTLLPNSNQPIGYFSLPDNFVGWAQITGSPGSNLVAQVVEQNANGFSTIFNAQAVTFSTLYAPTIFNNAFGGYDTGASIVNPNSNPVNVTINYYDNNGNALPPATFTLQPHELTSIYQGGTQGKSGVTGIPDGGLPDGFYGSATITSQGGGVAMLVNEIGPANPNTIASGSYTARPTPASTLTLPIICNGGYGYTTGLTVLNTSGAAVNATVQYFNTDGSMLKNANGSPLTASFSVAAHGSYPIFQGAAGLPSNFYGLAVVTTTSGPTKALIATTNAISSGNFYTYTEPEM